MHDIPIISCDNRQKNGTTLYCMQVPTVIERPLLPAGMEVRVHRPFGTLHDFVWQTLAFFNKTRALRRYELVNKEGQVVCYKHMIGKIYQFPFMSKGDLHSGPGKTTEAYRGCGYYTILTKYVLAEYPGRTIYAIIDDVNLLSKRTNIKLGFRPVAKIRRTSFLKRYIMIHSDTCPDNGVEKRVDNMVFETYKRCLFYRGNLLDTRKLSKEEMKYLLKNSNALFLLNPYDYDSNEKTSFWYVVRKRPYTVEDYSPKIRKQIRRSLKEYRYTRINPLEILDDVYRVYLEANQRLGVTDVMTLGSFKMMVTTSIKAGKEWWGGFHIEDDKLAMVEILRITKSGYAEMDAEWLSYKYTKHNPTYGLNDTIVGNLLGERGFELINAGARSLTEHSNVQDFLIEKFGFKKAYCRVQLYMPFGYRVVSKCLYPFRKLISNVKVKAFLHLCGYADKW